MVMRFLLVKPRCRFANSGGFYRSPAGDSPVRWNPLATARIGFDKWEPLAGRVLRHVARGDWHNERKIHGEERCVSFKVLLELNDCDAAWLRQANSST
jgi:hypothetical protein